MIWRKDQKVEEVASNLEFKLQQKINSHNKEMTKEKNAISAMSRKFATENNRLLSSLERLAAQLKLEQEAIEKFVKSFSENVTDLIETKFSALNDSNTLLVSENEKHDKTLRRLDKLLAEFVEQIGELSDELDNLAKRQNDLCTRVLRLESQAIGNLTPKQQQILRLLQQGVKQTAIATQVKTTKENVSRTKKLLIARGYIEEEKRDKKDSNSV